MPMSDVRVLKNNLRSRYISLRKKMSPHTKEIRDSDIYNRVINLRQYKTVKTLLTYVSKDIEVDTLRLIDRALQDGVKVAVPKCINGTREMEFYFINSLDMLEKGTFGVMEPNPDVCRKLDNFSDSMCIVPGMSFDVSGYRIGYGKGYYDRFLAGYEGTTVGVCYADCVRWKSLPRNKYDRPVDLIVTENYIRRTDVQRKSGEPKEPKTKE